MGHEKHKGRSHRNSSKRLLILFYDMSVCIRRAVVSLPFGWSAAAGLRCLHACQSVSPVRASDRRTLARVALDDKKKETTRRRDTTTTPPHI
jgi:hypothetical protein